MIFPPKTSKGGSKEAYKRGLGGNKQAERQAGRLSSGFRGQLTRSSLLGSHRRGFLYAHLLQTPPPLLCISGSPVYLPASPTRKRAAARLFPYRSQSSKASGTFAVLCFSTDKVLFGACARVWKRLAVMRVTRSDAASAAADTVKNFSALSTYGVNCVFISE